MDNILCTSSANTPILNMDVLNKAKQLLKEAEEKQEQMYLDLVKKKVGREIKEWLIIFPIEFEEKLNPVPNKFKDKIKFSRFIKNDAYILNGNPFDISELKVTFDEKDVY